MLNQTHLAPDEKRLLARFWQSASGYWRGPGAWRAWLLVAVLIATVILQLLTQYALNYWNRDFFNAIGRRDGRRTLDPGIAVCAAGRGQSRAHGLLGLGPHDHAAHLARVAQQSPL